MSAFNDSEVHLLTSTWALVEADLSSHGLNYFQYLFTEYPEVQAKYFPMMSMNDVINLGAHGIKVLSDVGIMVRFVKEKNDLELVTKINKVTQNHCKKGVGLVGFKVVTKTLHEYLVMSLGANLTPEGGKAWKKLLDTLLIVVEQELNRKDAQ
ncbi:hypothetical protein TCAL_15899 [Tigriopus californicus]|uniref:Globin domain-containing protein n=1 Tax=Tigriopus californicus TaxID=6832 RepID=A0A553PHV1_TIGCA|nr:hemoglobin subunit pi-like [Tigriopus californicus]TRY77254.1 hypothetical protein TCAL_15899 [Tigriopus californicus]